MLDCRLTTSYALLDNESRTCYGGGCVRMCADDEAETEEKRKEGKTSYACVRA